MYIDGNDVPKGAFKQALLKLGKGEINFTQTQKRELFLWAKPLVAAGGPLIEEDSSKLKKLLMVL